MSRRSSPVNTRVMVMETRQLTKRLGAIHYILNSVICAFYPTARLVPALRVWLLPNAGDFGGLATSREAQISCSVLALIAFKTITLSSAEERAEFIFLVCKITTSFLLYLHGQIKVLLVFLAVWFVGFIFFPQPGYRGASLVTILDEDTLFKQVLHRPSSLPNPSTISETKIWELADGEGDAESQAQGNGPRQQRDEAKNDLVWRIVLLGVSWSAASRNIEVIYSQLSLEYDCPQIKFYKIDPEVYVDVATEFDISVGPTSLDLPTIILFRQGQEVSRLPERKSAVVKKLSWKRSRASIVSTFDLDAKRKAFSKKA